MNKKSILYILLDLVFLAVFNTVFFVIGGTKHPASVWISYGFIHFAYLMTLATPFLIKKGGGAVVGVSIYSISTIYFFAEFVVGLIFILFGSESYKAALVVQVIIAGIYAITLISNMIANEYTTDRAREHEDRTVNIKNAASRVKALIGKSSDKKVNREIEKAYDLLHSSPSRSNVAVKLLEEEIVDKVTELENAAAANDDAEIVRIAGEIVAKTEERNRKLKVVN